MTAKVFIHSDLESFPDIAALAADFACYKDNQATPPYFGRDGDYRRPEACREEEVHHLHLSESIPPTSLWGKISNPFRRTSDKHLVYCRGFYDRESYLLITVLHPDAHNKAENMDLMLDIVAIAKKFRESN